MPDYNNYSPFANKILNPDGSVSTFDGSAVLPADAKRAEQYKNAAPIVNKVLNPDGGVSATLSGDARWGEISGNMQDQTDVNTAISDLNTAVSDLETDKADASDVYTKGESDAALAAKANVYVRQAQGITAGNNIQGMRVRVAPPAAYVSDWSFLTADGQSFVRTDNNFSYFDGQGDEVKIIEDANILIEDYTIAEPFLISAVSGSFSNPEFFWRYFDVKDIDQRIGYVSALETDDKSSVVNAVNSLKGYVDAIAESSEVSDSPFESYAGFLAGSGGGIYQGKYAYVTFTGTDAWPQGGKWDQIAAGDTWRLDCSASAWLPTSGMTAAVTATVTDAAATDALKAAGNDTVTSWLQSFRNNIKGLLGVVKTNGDGKKALLDNGSYGLPAQPWGVMNWTPAATQTSTVSETSLPFVGTAASSDFADISADGYITFKKAGRYTWYFGRMDMVPTSDNLWAPGITSLTGGAWASVFLGTPRLTYTEWGLGALNQPILIRSPAGGGARIMWSWCDAVMSWTFQNISPCQLILTGSY
jgi:hypothetical protein